MSRVASVIFADILHGTTPMGETCPRTTPVVKPHGSRMSGDVACVDCGRFTSHDLLMLIGFLEEREALGEVERIVEEEDEFPDGRRATPIARLRPSGGRVVVLSRPADGSDAPVACEALGPDIMIHRDHPLPAVIAGWAAALVSVRSVGKP